MFAKDLEKQKKVKKQDNWETLDNNLITTKTLEIILIKNMMKKLVNTLIMKKQ